MELSKTLFWINSKYEYQDHYFWYNTHRTGNFGSAHYDGSNQPSKTFLLGSQQFNLLTVHSIISGIQPQIIHN